MRLTRSYWRARKLMPRKTGAPRATAICRIVMQAFPAISYGQMKSSP